MRAVRDAHRLPPFPGETATDSISAALHREPDWSRLPAAAPPTIHLLLRRCLVKERAKRLHDIADARIEIEQAIADPSSTASIPALLSGMRASRGVPRGVMVGGAVVLMGAALYAGRWLARPVTAGPPLLAGARFTRVTDQEGVESSPSLSPDGGTVVYCAGPPDHATSTHCAWAGTTR